MIDLKTGRRFIRKCDCTMSGFRDALKSIITEHDLWINMLTMDNSGENNLLWEVVAREKMINFHAYCSGEKETLENSHRLIRRIVPKGKSMDDFTDNDIQIVEIFVNNYFSKTFKVL